MAVAEFTPLTAEQIALLQGKTRTKGAYAPVIRAFLDAGIPGTMVDLEAGAFAGKKAQSVKQGFENAARVAKEAAEGSDKHIAGVENFKVVEHEEKVFLLNNAAQA